MFLQSTTDTKKLRKIFDKNGVKWRPSMYMTDSLVGCETTWEFNGVNWYACESPYGGLILRTVDYKLTPEQVAEVMCITEATEVTHKIEIKEMKALDELRSCFDNFAVLNTEAAKKVVNNLADKIEKEIEQRYIELPLDKDGVPIRVRDEMADEKGKRFVVGEIDYLESCAYVFGIVDGVGNLYRPSEIVHHHEPTIEDTLRDFATACEDAGNAEDVINKLISKYAEKFQLKEN